MMGAWLRYLLAGVPTPPPLGRALWATLGVLALGALNVAFKQEIWPHTPGVAQAWGQATCLAALLALPQLAWWAGRWLWACTGPWWCLLALKIGFVFGLLPMGLLWLGGAILWLAVLR